MCTNDRMPAQATCDMLPERYASECHAGKALRSRSLRQHTTGCLRLPSLVDDSAFKLDHHLHLAQARAVPTFGQRPVYTTLLCFEKGETGHALRWARSPKRQRISLLCLSGINMLEMS